MHAATVLAPTKYVGVGVGRIIRPGSLTACCATVPLRPALASPAVIRPTVIFVSGTAHVACGCCCRGYLEGRIVVPLYLWGSGVERSVNAAHNR